MHPHRDLHTSSHADIRLPAWIAWSGLILGPALGLLVFLLLPHAQRDDTGAITAGLSDHARAVAGIATLMAVWWMTEAVPIEATSLLPLILFAPLGIATMKKAAEPYGSETVFFFMGGFMLGRAMERWGLHTRIALHILRSVGTSPARLVLGLMGATALISLFVNNTATTMVILPIGLSLAAAISQDHGPESRLAKNFALASILGIAYAASLGGMGTLVGTAPNIQLAGFFKNSIGQELSFARWLWIGLPIVAMLTPLTWLMLTRVLFPLSLDHDSDRARQSSANARERSELEARLREQLSALGPMSRGEWATLIVFSLAALGWIFREPASRALGLMTLENGREVSMISDAWIGIAASLLLFLIPIHPARRQFALDWPTASGLPWGVLLLFGGGLSLASAMTQHGIDSYIGSQLQALGHLPVWLLTLLVALVVAAASELASNTALTAAMLPLMLGVEKQLQLQSGTLLIPTTLAASCGFMLPVATPPNALAFATGRVPMRSMLRAGLLLDLLGVGVITLVFLTLGHLVMPR